MKLSILLQPEIKLDAAMEQTITGLAIDSRQVHTGYLFFACRGVNSDGREFISQAIANGAAAIIVDANENKIMTELGPKNKIIPVIHLQNLTQRLGFIAARFYAEPSNSLSVVGVTGTNGKTSCSHFIAACLQQLSIPCGVIGTLGYGMYGAVQPGMNTTPDAVTLQTLLAGFKQQGAKAVSMEVSSHALSLGRVNGTQFNIAVFTNLTRDHLDFHGDMQAYAAAKKKLFTDYKLQNAVINADDAFGMQLIEELKDEIPIYAYSTRAELLNLPRQVFLIQAEYVNFTATGIEAVVQTPWGQTQLQSQLLGHFNLSNLIATLSTLGVLGFALDNIVTALKSLKTVPGRMQSFGNRHTPLVVVDYAHTPDALEQALKALREHCDGVLWCVFGCGGCRDRGKRLTMAQVVESFADRVIVTDDNPRDEDPKDIVNDILQGLVSPKQVVIEHNRAKAISYAIEHAKPGDSVLIAGKGHEDYQQVGHVRRPFSDILQVKALLGM